jgi:hypothetical protein
MGKKGQDNEVLVLPEVEARHLEKAKDTWCTCTIQNRTNPTLQGVRYRSQDQHRRLVAMSFLAPIVALRH